MLAKKNYDAFPVSGSPHDSSTLGVWTGLRKESFFQTRNCNFEHKPTEGLPQYIWDNRHRVSSLLFSLRSICRAWKGTSQRKLESWHAGTRLGPSLKSPDSPAVASTRSHLCYRFGTGRRQVRLQEHPSAHCPHQPTVVRHQLARVLVASLSSLES